MNVSSKTLMCTLQPFYFGDEGDTCTCIYQTLLKLFHIKILSNLQYVVSTKTLKEKKCR